MGFYGHILKPMIIQYWFFFRFWHHITYCKVHFNAEFHRIYFFRTVLWHLVVKTRTEYWRTKNHISQTHEVMFCVFLDSRKNILKFVARVLKHTNAPTRVKIWNIPTDLLLIFQPKRTYKWRVYSSKNYGGLLQNRELAPLVHPEPEAGVDISDGVLCSRGNLENKSLTLNLRCGFSWPNVNRWPNIIMLNLYGLLCVSSGCDTNHSTQCRMLSGWPCMPNAGFLRCYEG